MRFVGVNAEAVAEAVSRHKGHAGKAAKHLRKQGFSDATLRRVEEGVPAAGSNGGGSGHGDESGTRRVSTLAFTASACLAAVSVTLPVIAPIR